MSPRTPSQYKKIRQDKKQLILDVTLNLFSEFGYQSTSISKIAKEANISKGLLYNYFENKKTLLEEVIIEGIERLLNPLNINPNNELTQKEFISLIEESFNKLIENITYWRLYFSVVLQPGIMIMFEKEVWSKLTPLMQKLNLYFEKNGAKDPIVETRFFFALMDGISIHFITDTNSFPLEKIKQKVISIYS